MGPDGEHDLREIAVGTPGVYKSPEFAQQWDRERSRELFEKSWLDRFLCRLPQNAQILDVGCGGGEPISRYLIEQGHRVTGIDQSTAMIDLARRRFPDADWRVGDMLCMDLGCTFDGVLAWNSFFHLTRDEQRQTLPRLAAHIGPGGALMTTVGPGDSEVGGTVAGQPVYHASLSQIEYSDRLKALGLRVEAFVPDDPECRGHSVLLAVRS